MKIFFPLWQWFILFKSFYHKKNFLDQNKSEYFNDKNKTLGFLLLLVLVLKGLIVFVKDVFAFWIKNQGMCDDGPILLNHRMSWVPQVGTYVCPSKVIDDCFLRLSFAPKLATPSYLRRKVSAYSWTLNYHDAFYIITNKHFYGKQYEFVFVVSVCHYSV